VEGQTERKDNRRTFSVSKAFEDVHKILDELPANEASRFICEAVRHYHQVKNNPNWMGDQFRRLMSLSAELQTMLTSFGGQGQMPSTPFPGHEQTGYGSSYMQQPMQHPFPYPNYPPMNPYGQPGMMPQQPVQHVPTSVDEQSNTTDTPSITVTPSSDPSHIKDVSQGVQEIAVGASDESGSGDTLAVEKGERIPNRTNSSSDESSKNDGSSETGGKKNNKVRFRSFISE